MYCLAPGSLDLAREVLGLELHLTVDFRPIGGERYGEYRGTDDLDRHHIILDPGWGSEDLNLGFWHEAVHAKQNERCAVLPDARESEFFLQYMEQAEAAGLEITEDDDGNRHIGVGEESLIAYRSIPFEIEADLLGRRYAARHEVVRSYPETS